MNKEAFEALKRIINYLNVGNKSANWIHGERRHDIKDIESWIDEVAKEYEEDMKHCDICGKKIMDLVYVNNDGRCENCREQGL